MKNNDWCKRIASVGLVIYHVIVCKECRSVFNIEVDEGICPYCGTDNNPITPNETEGN